MQAVKKLSFLPLTACAIDTSWLVYYLRHAKKANRKSEKLQLTFIVYRGCGAVKSQFCCSDKIWYMTSMFSQDLMHCNWYIVLISQTGRIHVAHIRSFFHTPSHLFSTFDRPLFVIYNTHALYLPSALSHCHWFPHPQFITHSHSSFVFVPQPNFWSTPTQLHIYLSIKLSNIPLIRYICHSNYTQHIKWNIQINSFAFIQFG